MNSGASQPPSANRNRPPMTSSRPHGGGGGFGMTPLVCCVLVCRWRCLLADRHSLPFPLTLSLRRRWCPSASHHPLTFLFLPALTFPLPCPFPSLGLSLRRPQCPWGGGGEEIPFLEDSPRALFEGEEGGGSGAQKCVHQKWPDKIFLLSRWVTLVWGGGPWGGGGGTPPPPAVDGHSKTSPDSPA